MHGLQVMGLLETRCLDFKNIIITSANERVLPRKFRSSTFISDFMRRSFGMSTTAHQEAMWTYYFYRLIGRASNVFLLYDTSAQAMGSGEHSRFVEQLEKVYGCKVHHTTLNMELPPSKGLNISVPKLGHVLDEVNGYKTGNRMLSASSIKEYVDCPLMFYFHHIEHLSADNDEVDFMDASTFGTIAHETLQELFYPDVDGQSRSGDYRVTCAMIEDFEKNKLDTVVRHKVNEQYVHCDDLDAPLAGEASIVSVAVKMFVKNALRYDKELLSNIGSNAFTVLECERNISARFVLVTKSLISVTSPTASTACHVAHCEWWITSRVATRRALMASAASSRARRRTRLCFSSCSTAMLMLRKLVATSPSCP